MGSKEGDMTFGRSASDGQDSEEDTKVADCDEREMLDILLR